MGNSVFNVKRKRRKRRSDPRTDDKIKQNKQKEQKRKEKKKSSLSLKQEFHELNWLKDVPEGEEESPQVVMVLCLLVRQLLH